MKLFSQLNQKQRNYSWIILLIFFLNPYLITAQLNPDITLIPENYSGSGSNGHFMESNNGIPFTHYEILEYNGYLYYTASTQDEGWELWRTDGNTTELFYDFNSGSDHGHPRSFHIWNGMMYLRAKNDSGTNCLWRTDGSVSGTQQVFASTCCGSKLKSTYGELNGKLYVSGFPKLLEVSNSGTAGYVDDGNGSSIITKPTLVASNGSILYIITEMTNPPNYNGQEFLFISDGTESGLALSHVFGYDTANGETREPDYGDDTSLYPPYFDDYMIVGGNFVFVAPGEGGKLYANGGPILGTEELEPGLTGVHELTMFNGAMHFSADGNYASLGLPYTKDIWSTTGAIGGPFQTDPTHMELAMAEITHQGKVPENNSLYYAMKVQDYVVEGETIYRTHIVQRNQSGFVNSVSNVIPPQDGISLSLRGHADNLLFYWKRTGNDFSNYQTYIYAKQAGSTGNTEIVGPNVPTSSISDPILFNGEIIMAISTPNIIGIKLWKWGNINLPCTAPIAGFNQPTSGQVNVPVPFGNTSTYDMVTGSMLWDFGDGNTSTSDSPSHTYSNVGTYIVCLVVTDSCAADTICSAIVIDGCTAPIAGFNQPTSGQVNVPVPFGNTSTYDMVTGSMLWDFGDGNTSTSDSPSHTYSNVGTYIVCLVVTDSCAADTICSAIVIDGCTAPIASFNPPSSGQAGSTLYFNNTSTFDMPSGNMHWDFGDGMTSTDHSPFHTYTTEGTYIVCLEVTDTCSSDTICNQIIVASCNPPMADFYPGDETYDGLTVYFSDLSTSDSGGTAFWDFGDGNTSTDPFPMHTYGSTGTYTVCLEYTDACGVDITCKTLVITNGGTGCNPPVADFYPGDDTYDGLTVYFSDLSMSDTGGSLLWDFGDGNTSTDPFPVHTYASTGTYTVCLEYTDACGVDTTCKVLTIIDSNCQLPTASFTWSQTDYTSGTISFANTSTDATSYLWDFGQPWNGNNNSTMEHPNHAYSAEGYYTVTLIATNACGSDTTSTSVFVECYMPTAGFTTSVLGGDQVYITSTGQDYTQVTYDFGDGNSTNADNPNHTYSASGTYTIIQYAENACDVDVYSQEVTITCQDLVANGAYVQNNPEVPGIHFTNLSTGYEVVFWDFGDGMDAEGYDPYHLYAAPGTYTACIEAFGNCNQADTFCLQVIVTAASNDIYVDENAMGNNDGTSWTNAFNDLQDALAIGENKTIHVAQGTYYPTSGTSRGIFFNVPEGANLWGGYPTGGGERNPEINTTRLSGDIDGDQTLTGNSYHVIRLQNVMFVNIDGFHISGGNADIANSFGRSRGGGIYARNADALIGNCIIEDNYAVYGAGIFATLSPQVAFEYCTFRNNTGDYGSAVYHSNQTSLYLNNSNIIDNTSLQRCAIEVNNSYYTSINQSLIANNASTKANAIALVATNRNQTCDIFNSTIVGYTNNKYLMTMQAGFGDQLDVNIYNSILAHQNPSFNRTIKTYVNGTLNLLTHHCYIQSGTVYGTTLNNIYSTTAGDVMMNPDYSLDACSPAVDMGDDNIYTHPTDLAGNNRLFNSIDLGAFETQTSCNNNSRFNDENQLGPKQDIGFSIYPNPAVDYIVIEKMTSNEAPVMIEIWDNQGRLISHTEQSFQVETIALDDLPNGLYHVRLIQGDHQETHPVSLMK